MDFWTRFAIHTVIVAIGLGLFLRTLYGRARVLQSVQWTNLFDKIPERIQALLVIGFGQKKFLIDKREKSAGWMHFFIFWGFTILGVQVIHMFGRMFFPDFTLPTFNGKAIVLIVPAVIMLMGRWNWWLPAWAARALRTQPSEPAPEVRPATEPA